MTQLWMKDVENHLTFLNEIKIRERDFERGKFERQMNEAIKKYKEEGLIRMNSEIYKDFFNQNIIKRCLNREENK